MRRDVGRHADGDAARTVDEQIGEACRQDRRLDPRLVVVRHEINRLFIDVGERLGGDVRQPRLCVAVSRRRVAVYGAEVALPLDERVAHRKVLRHAHHRIVDRRIAVRVIFAEHVAYDRRRFLVRLAGIESHFMHGVKNAPVHRLQAVARVGQRPANDDAHGVVEVTTPHLFFNINRNLLCCFSHYLSLSLTAVLMVTGFLS